MPLLMKHILASDPDLSTSSATEYRQRYMSPRREDYIPHVALPEIGTHRPASRHRSFLSAEIDANAPLSPSEYRLRYSNHRPKRPYVFQAQPSRIFDFLPMPNTATSTPRLQPSTYRTEYLDRFPNYRSFVPLEQLMPPHFSSQLNTPSIAQQKKDRMTRSQHFQDLATQHDPSPYEHKQLGDTEQRSAFRWPGLSQ